MRFTTGLNPHTISLSADGRSLVYSAFTMTSNVWMAPLHGADPIAPGAARQITFGKQTIQELGASTDGRWLTYDSNLNGNGDIYKISLHGGEPQQLTRDPTDGFAPHWSPNGTEIAFHSFRNGNRDIFVVSADGSRTETVVAKPNQKLMPRFSPDGTRLAFQNPGGIFAVPARGGPQTRIVTASNCSASGSFEWSLDSKLIYYCTSAGGIGPLHGGAVDWRCLKALAGVH